MLALLLLACFPRIEPSGSSDRPDEDDSADPALVETRCGDGEDDDGDGDVDCDDADCVDARPCEEDTDTTPDEETDCNDGEDEDGDGDTDCDDSDCAGASACDEPDECWDDDADDTLGFEIATGTTAGNDGSASCGGSSSADSFVRWEAPETATYVFDTVGSEADTTLWVASETCDGEELACNEDTLAPASQVAVDLEEGEVVVVGIEASGAWVLSAWEGECPAYSIGEILAVTGSTAAFTEDYDGSCETAGSAITLRWVAPSSGTWTFSTDGSDFDTVLVLFDGSCEGEQLGCNDDSVSTVRTSEVSVDLTAGDVVAIALGGYNGDQGTYALAITAE